jgi:hypothetical protein
MACKIDASGGIVITWRVITSAAFIADSFLSFRDEISSLPSFEIDADQASGRGPLTRNVGIRQSDRLRGRLDVPGGPRSGIRAGSRLYAQGNGCGVTRIPLRSVAMKVLTLSNTPVVKWR